MAKNVIGRLYKSNEGQFLKHLSEAGALGEEPLHRVRVGIKNMRSLVDLLNALSRKNKGTKSLLRSLDPLFSSAGEIRSISLSLKLSAPYRSEVLNRFREHLHLRREEAASGFLDELASFKKRKFRKRHRKALGNFRSMKEKRIRSGAVQYLRSLFAEIRADLFDINDDESLHQIRKRIRCIRNVGQVLNRMQKNHPFREELRKIESTYDQIGKWHDSLDLLNALEKYVEELDDPVALERAGPLMLRLKKACLLSKRRIERKLKSDLVM